MKEKFTLGAVGLIVSDLNQSLEFYTRIVGLKLLKQEPSIAYLGVSDAPILILYEDKNAKAPQHNYSGLYHIALLVSQEEMLGQILLHWIRVQFVPDGAGDHLYSQALYLHDPDGHGIEIYADRPRSSWNILDDGQIITGTNPVDTDRLLELVTKEDWNGLPEDTILGHVHLSVQDISAFEAFYVNDLGFDLKTIWGDKARFVSKDGYHHHIGANSWHRPSGPLPSDTLGLKYITLEFADNDPVLKTIKAAQIIDPNGIHIHITNNTK